MNFTKGKKDLFSNEAKKMINSKKDTVIIFLMIIMTFSLCKGAGFQMKKCNINLPKTIAVWTRPDSPKMIDSTNIFDYMNGAGELYLGYRFNHLEVYEYTTDHQHNIVVELYFMETSDDAFGLLSLDWGGDPVIFDPSTENHVKHSIVPLSRALYGGGLLRICSRNIYARVMAYQETPASKEAVLSLGQAIVANRKNPPEPELLNILPPAIGSDWKLRNDRIGYFRSHLVLNSFYYLSHQNILNLDHSTEGITALYEKMMDVGDVKRVQFLFIKYENHQRAQNALNHFHKAYLPDHQIEIVPESKTRSTHFFRIEDGWLGYQLCSNCIMIVFECPDQETARIMINQIELNQ